MKKLTKKIVVVKEEEKNSKQLTFDDDFLDTEIQTNNKSKTKSKEPKKEKEEKEVNVIKKLLFLYQQVSFQYFVQVRYRIRHNLGPYENRIMFAKMQQIEKSRLIHQRNQALGRKSYLLTILPILPRQIKIVHAILRWFNIEYFSGVEFTKLGAPHLHVTFYPKDEEEVNQFLTKLKNSLKYVVKSKKSKRKSKQKSKKELNIDIREMNDNPYYSIKGLYSDIKMAKNQTLFMDFKLKVAAGIEDDTAHIYLTKKNEKNKISISDCDLKLHLKDVKWYMEIGLNPIIEAYLIKKARLAYYGFKREYYFSRVLNKSFDRNQEVNRLRTIITKARETVGTSKKTINQMMQTISISLKIALPNGKKDREAITKIVNSCKENTKYFGIIEIYDKNKAMFNMNLLIQDNDTSIDKEQVFKAFIDIYNKFDILDYKFNDRFFYTDLIKKLQNRILKIQDLDKKTLAQISEERLKLNKFYFSILTFHSLRKTKKQKEAEALAQLEAAKAKLAEQEELRKQQEKLELEEAISKRTKTRINHSRNKELEVELDFYNGMVDSGIINGQMVSSIEELDKVLNADPFIKECFGEDDYYSNYEKERDYRQYLKNYEKIVEVQQVRNMMNNIQKRYIIKQRACCIEKQICDKISDEALLQQDCKINTKIYDDIQTLSF